MLSLDFAFRRQQPFQLRKNLLLVHARLFHQRNQLLHFILQLPLQLGELQLCLADFRAHVLAAAEAASAAKRVRQWRIWTLAGATAAIVALMMAATIYRSAALAISEDELAAVQKLTEWRAPSDALLETPGQEILRTMPRLGESYLNVPVKKNEEE